MYQPGLDLSVVEIEEGDSILEHLGDVNVGPFPKFQIPEGHSSKEPPI